MGKKKPQWTLGLIAAELSCRAGGGVRRTVVATMRTVAETFPAAFFSESLIPQMRHVRTVFNTQ